MVIHRVLSVMACYVDELPAILDSFFTSSKSDYIRVAEGNPEVAGNYMLRNYTCFMNPLVFEMSQKVANSVDNITTKPCKTLQSIILCLTASRDH